MAFVAIYAIFEAGIRGILWIAFFISIIVVLIIFFGIIEIIRDICSSDKT